MPELAATLTTDEHGSRVGHEELPPFIQTQADLDRWRLCLGIAERMTGQHESTQDVWHASRVLFFSDIPTVSQDSAFRLQGGEGIEEARRPQRRDRLGQYADMPNIPKPVLPKRTLRRSGRSAPSSPGTGQLDLIDDAGWNEWPKQTDLARTVLAGHAFTHERWMLKKQPPASPGYDPLRHPLYKARRGRMHRRIIGRQLALAVEPLLGADHPTTVKLRRGGLPTAAEKEEVRRAAERARGGAKPQALLLGGGPASGKTTVLNNNPELKPKFSVEVDPDAIKKRLPEYRKLVRAKDRYAALAVHRESGDIAARLYDEATDLGLNVVVDGTGDAEPGAFLADLRRARQGGYEVEVVYVNRSTEESIALAIRRAEEEGRWVPLPVLRRQHAAVSRNFRDEISHQDWLTINVYDAEGHVAAITHGRADIFNRSRFEEFIVKAEEED